MEVYEDPQTLSFVHNVGEGDAVTIPFLNYHPVFSQEEPRRRRDYDVDAGHLPLPLLHLALYFLESRGGREPG
jgi:hypothetical protein